ncbi:hypothetical protein [Paenibacillus agricola]|uniref:DUF1453 family protein n=1 Tax=Paenibacillus agricola TaxID=2716264 RepID=A0ABX0JH12_9BACL|nr:hypothetical protein [Paenibacillus agricola]NHN34564.1 hypothetical protein [Paenibacillus agricola]
MEHLGSTILIMAIVAFAIYRRVKRTVGYQKLSRTRLIFRTVMFGLLGCIFLYVGFLHPLNLVADGIGLAAGLVLAFYAIKHIRFEKRVDAWYYRTALWVEITLIVLLLGRIIYKLLSIYLNNPVLFQSGAAPSLDSYTKDPVTVGIFFVLISFYIRYFTYLLGKSKELEPASKLDIS